MVFEKGDQCQQLEPVDKGCLTEEVMPGYRDTGRGLFRELWSAGIPTEQQSANNRWVGICVRIYITQFATGLSGTAIRRVKSAITAFHHSKVYRSCLDSWSFYKR